MATNTLSAERGSEKGSRSYRRLRAVLRPMIDLAVLSAALWIAYLLRFEGDLGEGRMGRALMGWPWVVGAQYAALVCLRVPRFHWSSIGVRELPTIAAALFAVAAAFLVLRFGFPELGDHSLLQGVVLHASIVILDAGLALAGIVLVRGLRRVQVEMRHARELPARTVTSEARRTILVGAGRGGLLLARELHARPNLGIQPVAFVDDDLAMQGKMVHGIPVVGTLDELSRIARERDAEVALITIASADGRSLSRIARLCEEAGLVTKTVPRVHEILSGRVSISHIRDVAIEDLLGRDAVVLEDSAAPRVIRGKVCFVTGAGGSIGSELCRQILRVGPAKLVLCEQSEPSLYQIHRELSEACGEAEVVPAVADVCDEGRMRELFLEHRPHVLFHAAAHKHVPMMELNPGEAIKNNVLGTRTVADLAHEFAIERFVLISTDKAVRPSSVMGASKRLAELFVQERARSSAVRFATVRFGNVLGSAGSVIPLFREQIARGGPVTVTHPEMERYFMTIPEASRLVLEAAGLCEDSELMVLDMGHPIKILTLAEQMIRLSGLEPYRDVEIRFTGVREGEKLYEEIRLDGEQVVELKFGKIAVLRAQRAVGRVREALEEFEEHPRPAAAAREFLATLVDEYAPEEELREVTLVPRRPRETDKSPASRVAAI